MKNWRYGILLLFFMTLGNFCFAQYKESDWAKRDTWMKVNELMKLAQVDQGSAVADIGCHEGYLSIRLANEVGNLGKVYAVDVRQDRLDRLDEHLKDRKLTHVQTVLGDYNNPKLPLGQLDSVIIMDTYHEMESYMTILEHVKKALKPGGHILILEKLKKHMRDKSRDEQTDAHTLSSQYVKAELEEAGFEISEEIDNFGNWKNEKDKQMWILVATLPE